MKEPNRWMERLLVDPNKKRKQSRSFLRLIAPSVLSIFLCAICLAGLTWAWFVDQDTCEVGAIQTSRFTVSAKVSNNTENAEIPENSDGSYTLQSGSQYTVTLTASGTASIGYCVITVGDKEYVTTQIEHGQSLTFTVDCAYAESEVVLTVTPNWMTYSSSENAADLLGNGLLCIEIGAAPAEPEETQQNETVPEQVTEPEQTSAAETEETDQPSEAPSGAESTESPEPSVADTLTEPMPEGGETTPTEGDVAPSTEGSEAPPAEGSETPPAAGDETSPTEGSETPPVAGDETTPTKGGETPPAAGDETTPTEGGETSPTEGGETSPTEGGETSPTEGGETSPAEGDIAPPQEQEIESQPENPEASPSEP